MNEIISTYTWQILPDYNQGRDYKFIVHDDLQPVWESSYSCFCTYRIMYNLLNKVKYLSNIDFVILTKDVYRVQEVALGWDFRGPPIPGEVFQIWGFLFQGKMIY